MIRHEAYLEPWDESGGCESRSWGLKPPCQPAEGTATPLLWGLLSQPPPPPATASFSLISQSSVLSWAETRVFGRLLYTRSPRTTWVKAAAFQRARGSCYSSGSLQTTDLQCSPRNTSARWQGWQITVGRESRSLE